MPMFLAFVRVRVQREARIGALSTVCDVLADGGCEEEGRLQDDAALAADYGECCK